MTDTMIPRQRIAEVLFDNDDGAPRYHSIDDGEMSYPLSFWDIHESQQDEYLQAADRIIDIMREALLGDAALVALCTTREYVKYSGEGNGWREGMEAALDAAFGEPI